MFMKALQETDFIEKLSKLKSLLFKFDTIYEEEKLILLNDLINYTPKKTVTFLSFHHLLMAMMAYPASKNLLEVTNATMQNLLLVVEKNKSLQQKLIGTGLLHTDVECNFSYAKIIYITQKFPNQISIHSASSNLETQKSILKLILPNVEYSSIHEGEKDLKNRIATFHSSKQTDLEWLLQTIKQSTLDIKTQAFLYNQLGIFITYKIVSKIDSVSFLRGTNLPTYYHVHPLEKKISLQDIIKQKLPSPVKLTDKDKERIIDAAKMTLFYLYRETEPFTNANKDDITLFQLNKGISVALFGSTNDKRYSLESYSGYLVFKNNIPASYGGGWIFGERSQFGINILESFRGGESSLIICELLRVYHQFCGVTRFVVKPYQFGLHNPEAIKTGAFWFYYKLGFKPENKELLKLALEEEKQKLLNPTYKSTESTLKKYTKSNIALTLSNSTYPNYDSEVLSKKITHYINTQYKGDREKALYECFKRFKNTLTVSTKTWKLEDVQYAKQFSILCCTHPEPEKWMLKNKKNIISFIQLKSAKTELAWIKHLQKFKGFWEL